MIHGDLGGRVLFHFGMEMGDLELAVNKRQMSADRKIAGA